MGEYVIYFLLGTVICLDTVRIDIPRGDWTAAKDTKSCRWEDQQVKDRLYFIRIFYCPGEPMQEHIGKYCEHVGCVNRIWIKKYILMRFI